MLRAMAQEAATLNNTQTIDFNMASGIVTRILESYKAADILNAFYFIYNVMCILFLVGKTHD
jgi:hypothetical protein